jgi:hypothetical protein
MYNRFDLAVHSNENLNNTLSVLHNNTSFLNDYAKLLKKVYNFFLLLISIETSFRSVPPKIILELQSLEMVGMLK